MPGGAPLSARPGNAAGGDILVVGGTELATPVGSAPLAGDAASRLRLVPDAAIVARGGIITHVGPLSTLPDSVRSDPSLTVLDAGGGTILPGFVDAHTHAVHAGSREDEFRRRLDGESYSDIAASGGGIVSTVKATRAASLEELADLTARRLRTMLTWGTTTAEVKSGYGLDLHTELRQLRAAHLAAGREAVEVVPTYLGAHAIPPEFRDDRRRYVDHIVTEVLPAVAEEGLADFCDVFCDEGAFTVAESRRVLERAASLGLGRKVHADELGPTGGARLAAEVGATSAEHLLHASPDDIQLLARAGVVAVLLPATSFFLMVEPARAATFRDAGCPMAIATDLNPGSSHTECLPLAGVLACLRGGMLPEEALTAMTLNAACAVGRGDRLGSLEIGKQLDAVVLDAPNHLHLTYHFGVNLVRHVIKAGRVVVRDGVPCQLGGAPR